jgi:FkbM family methyltransferase
VLAVQILKDLRLAETCQQQPSTTVVDVGGFLGDFGLAAAAVGCSVVIFEVQPKQVELIQASISLNGFQDRVTLVNAAVSNTSGASVTFAAAGAC